MAHMDQPDLIHLRDYVVEAEIGAFQSERGRTQRLRFDISVELAATTANAGDHVDAIMSYDMLTRAVAESLADQRYNLVETLAERIAAVILLHPQAALVRVRVEKLDRIPGALGVTITRRAGRVAIEAAGAPPVTVLLRTADCTLPGGAVVVVPDSPRLALPQGGDRRRITLLALDQAAWALAGILGLEVAETRTELDHAILGGRAVVWAPARLSSDAPEAGSRPLDLAIWLAGRLDAGTLAIALPKGAELPAAPAGLGARIRRA